MLLFGQEIYFLGSIPLLVCMICMKPLFPCKQVRNGIHIWDAGRIPRVPHAANQDCSIFLIRLAISVDMTISRKPIKVGGDDLKRCLCGAGEFSRDPRTVSPRL